MIVPGSFVDYRSEGRTTRSRSKKADKDCTLVFRVRGAVGFSCLQLQGQKDGLNIHVQGRWVMCDIVCKKNCVFLLPIRL